MPPPDVRADVKMALLDRVMAQPFEGDYAGVRQRSASRRRLGLIATVIVLALFGMLVATAALQREREEPSLMAERQRLLERITAREASLDALQALSATVSDDVDQLREAALESTGAGAAASDELQRLELAAGTVAVTGPGVQIVVDDASADATGADRVLDVDLQILVNGLWAAGAEAIAINGHRLTSVTAIRSAGSAITVGYRSLARPYVVEAIGDPDSLGARFVETEAGATWLGLEQNFGLRFDLSSADSLSLPAEPRVVLQHAQVLGTDTGDTG